ncbi:MAG: hypothetical protein LBE36_00090 [Flavobacteriaceae bacterium]|jgi:hypothetical protein|nr:hypothetical protein [Flavobacteriaceae bacterium]
MKHNFLLFLLVISIPVYAQVTPSGVGINTTTPNATLDVRAKAPATTITKPEGIIAPKLSLKDLDDAAVFFPGPPATSLYTIAQNGTIVYVDNVDVRTDPLYEPTDQTVNITSIGYYFFQWTGDAIIGSGKWQSFGTAEWIYMPPFDLEWIEEEEGIEVDLYEKYTENFEDFVTTSVASPGAPAILPGFRAATDFYYVITHYPTDSIKNIVIDPDGKMTYDCTDIAPPVGEFATIILIKK